MGLGRRRAWLAVVALLVATASATSAEDAAIAEMEARVFARVNAHRVSIGLPELALSRELAESARDHPAKPGQIGLRPFALGDEQGQDEIGRQNRRRDEAGVDEQEDRGREKRSAEPDTPLDR